MHYHLYSNNSWFEIRSSYSGIYDLNTTDNIPPSSNVYYLLNFNNILASYGIVVISLLLWLLYHEKIT